MKGIKEVFFLGAGASADAGAPLSVSFLSDDYLDNKLQIKTALTPPNVERFEKLRRIVKQIFPFSAGDIESLLNGTTSALFLGLMEEGEIEKSWDITSPLEKEIEWYILQIIFLSLKQGRINEDAVLSYNRFFGELEDGDSIITLNYDLIADHSLLTQKSKLDYSIESSKMLFPVEYFEATSGIPIYKLHGSMNWLACPKCKKISIFKEKIAQYVEDPNLQTKFKCNECSSELQRVIVPPRWDKDRFYSEILNNIWRKAFSKLLNAHEVNVIGYSLPESDIYARNLLAISLFYNKALHINVINSNEKTLNKYEEFLKYANVSPDRYSFVRYKFKEYIDISIK